MTVDTPVWVKNYQPGVPAEIERPTDSLPHMLQRSVAAGQSEIATEFFGATMTYADLGDQVDRVAEGLRRLGVNAGDRVALVLPNCPQHVIAFYAVLRLGAIVVEHNPLYTERELGSMIADHGATVAICWDVAAAKLPSSVSTVVAVNLIDAMPLTKRLGLALPLPKLRAARAKLHASVPGALTWRDIVAPVPISRHHPMPALTDTAVIQYTSGTTGAFRGAILTHDNLYCNALQGAAWMKDAVDGREISYALLPMFHAFGMTLYLTFGIMKRMRLVLFPSFDVDMVLDTALKSPPTVYCAVPPIYRRTAERAIERGVSLKSAKFCISGAMALTDDIVELWESVSGGLLVEGYGLTEASPVALGNPFWPTRHTGTVGVPFPSTLMRVVDPENPDRDVPPGETGELLIHGPQVFQGYWNDPEATARTLLPGGWLRTGDLVVVGDDLNTTVVDRLKELIITGGFNVSPSEVEGQLREHPDIADVAVIGVPGQSGEDVTAVIVPRDGATIERDALRAWAKERMAAYKAPRRVVIVDELPKSMLGKVLRSQVRDEVMARQDG